MKFEKDGKLYANIDALLHEACPIRNPYCFRESCMIRDKALKEQDSCYAYAAEHQRETARYFGFEVIEDTPDSCEVAENHGEDVKPKRRTLGTSDTMDEMAEYAEKYLEAVKPDPVNRPAHYTSGGIECIDAMQAAFGDEAVKDFCLCNAFKYLWRHRNKNGVEDLKKARWYLNWLIREMEVKDDE